MPNNPNTNDVMNPPTPENEQETRQLPSMPRPKEQTLPAPPMPQKSTVDPMMTQQMKQPQQTNEPMPEEKPQPVAGAEQSVPQSQEPQMVQSPPTMQQASMYPPGMFQAPQVENPDLFVRDAGYIPTGYDPVQDWQMEIAGQNDMLQADHLLNRVGGNVFDPNMGVEAPVSDNQSNLDYAQQVFNRARTTHAKWYMRERFGWNPSNTQTEANGTTLPLVPQVDGDLSTNGFVTQTAKGIVNTFGGLVEKAGFEVPKELGNTVTSIQDFLWQDIHGLSSGIHNRLENLGDEELERIRSGKGTLGDVVWGGLKTGISHVLSPLSNWREHSDPEKSKQVQAENEKKFQDTINRFTSGGRNQNIGIAGGDYGNAGILSSGLWALNYAMGLASGAVYDIVDNTVQKIVNGKDPYDGSRFWDAATKARDFSVLQRWTPENYLSVMEPEGQKPGELKTKEDFGDTALPGTATFFNLPEHLSVNASQLNHFFRGEEFTDADKQKALEKSKAWHWATQLAPGIAIEFLGDSALDNLIVAASRKAKGFVGKKAQDFAEQVATARHAKPVDPLENGAGIVTNPPEKIKVNKATNTVTIPAEDGHMGLVVKISPEPSGAILDPNKALDETAVNLYMPKGGMVDNPKLNKAVDNVQRDPDTLGRLANQINGTGGRPLAQINRPLTDNELAVLRSGHTVLFGENGMPLNVQKLENATHVIDGEGQAFEIVRPTVMPDGDDILGVTNANAVEQFKKADEQVQLAWGSIPKSKVPTPEDLMKYNEAMMQRQMAVAKMADNGEAYNALRPKMPKELNTPGAQEAGNGMISKNLQLQGEAAEAVKLDHTIADITHDLRKVEPELKAFPYYRGDLISEQHTTEWATEAVNPELGITNPNPSPAPPLTPRPYEKYDIPKALQNSGDQEKVIEGIQNAKVKVRKWNSERQAKIPADWAHGTSSKADLRAVDPIQGGSPSEFGLGVYLTRDLDTAKAAGRKGHLANKPFTQVGDDFTKPRIHEVNVSRLDGVLLGNDAVGADIRRMYETIAKETLEEYGLPSKAFKLRDRIKNRELFNEFKRSYYELFDDVLPEQVNRKFQQKLTRMFSDTGIQGMYVNRNGIETLVVYTPSQLEVSRTLQIPRTNTLGETLESTRYLESRTFEQLGDDVSRANFAKAKKDLLDWKLQEAVTERAVKEGKMVNLVDELQDYTDEVIEKGRKATKANHDELLENPKRIVDEHAKPHNEDFC